jgi:23S rRNA (cytosine1962-C5)-methyltransferase
MNLSLHLLSPTTWRDYALLDSGDGQRLERFGNYTLIRPEPHALWRPALDASEWDAATIRYVRESGEKGEWVGERLPHEWTLRYNDLRFSCRLTPFRHTGVFPEQATNWEWCANLIRQRSEGVRVLNLFGYTGLATLAAAAAGATVTHVDASRPAMTWARENQSLSGLDSAPIRWLIEDVAKFVKREVRRGSYYDGIILDPPAFGRGPKGEIWRFSDDVPALMDDLRHLLSPQPLFLLLNAYAINDSASVLANLVAQTVAPHKGTLEAGELALQEEHAGRYLFTSLFARWSASETT